jgi:hypothetical protein
MALLYPSLCHLSSPSDSRAAPRSAVLCAAPVRQPARRRRGGGEKDFGFPLRSPRRRFSESVMRHDASQQGRRLDVDAEQCRQRLFRPPPPTALRRDAVIADVAARGLHALARTLNAVRVMHESQVELRLGVHLEVVQRRKVRVVVASLGTGMCTQPMGLRTADASVFVISIETVRLGGCSACVGSKSP